METIRKTQILNKLSAHAREFLQENFNMTLEIPIDINGRLRTSGGVFKCQHHVYGGIIPLTIEIAKFMIESGTYTEIVQTLEHELVHYALCVLGKPYRDNSATFIATCERLNVPLHHNVVKNLYQYECVECHKVHELARIIPQNHYMICDKCNNKIVKSSPCKIITKQLRILK